MKRKIIIVSGDPLSVNSEIIFKSWKKLSSKTKKSIYLISNYNLMKKQFDKLNYSIKMIKVKDIDENYSDTKLKIININCKFNDPFKLSKKERSKFVYKSLNYSHNIAIKNDDVNGVINCPISKTLLNKKNIGITEYFASKCKIKSRSEVMLIYNKKLSVSPITTHIDLKNVAKNIKSNIIFNKVRTIEKWFKYNHKKKPRIGILGLNPHNAELRKNSIEKKIIIPVIKKLKKIKIKVEGPLTADTVFINDYKNFDVIVGMYHDQVLAPFKTLFKFDAINITLGLRYLRASPDHGVALKLIKKKRANASSLIKCINFIKNYKK